MLFLFPSYVHILEVGNQQDLVWFMIPLRMPRSMSQSIGSSGMGLTLRLRSLGNKWRKGRTD